MQTSVAVQKTSLQPRCNARHTLQPRYTADSNDEHYNEAAVDHSLRQYGSAISVNCHTTFWPNFSWKMLSLAAKFWGKNALNLISAGLCPRPHSTTLPCNDGWRVDIRQWTDMTCSSLQWPHQPFSFATFVIEPRTRRSLTTCDTTNCNLIVLLTLTVSHIAF